MCRGALPRTRGEVQSCGPPADSPMWWELDTDIHSLHPGFRDPNTHHPAVVGIVTAVLLHSYSSVCPALCLCLSPRSLCLWVWVNVPPSPRPPNPPLLPALPALSPLHPALRPPSPPRRGGPAGGAAGGLGDVEGGEAGRRGGGAAGRAAAASGPVAMGPEAAQAAAAAQTKARAARRARGVGAAGRTRLRRDARGEPSRQGEPGQPRLRAGAGGPEVPGPGEGAGSPEVLDTEAEGGPGSSEAPGLAGLRAPSSVARVGKGTVGASQSSSPSPAGGCEDVSEVPALGRAQRDPEILDLGMEGGRGSPKFKNRGGAEDPRSYGPGVGGGR